MMLHSLIRSLGLGSIALSLVAWGAESALRAAEPTAAELARSLQAKDVAARVEALDRIGRLGDEARTLVPDLSRALGDPDAGVRWRAARTLGGLGEAAAPSATALVQWAGDEDAKVRAYVAFALGRTNVRTPPVVEALTGHITDPDPLVRRAAIDALRRLQPDPQVVGPLVVKALEDADHGVVAPAIALIAEGGRRIVPQLIDSLQRSRARYWACLVLAEIGPDAADAVPALRGILSDPEPETRLQALMALGEIGNAAAPAAPDIAAVLAKDAHEGVRYAAAYALGSIKAPAGEPALKAGLNHSDPMLRLASAWALARLHPDDPAAMRRAVLAIAEALSDKDARVRSGAARALVHLNPPMEISAPIFTERLAKNADPTVANNAVEALSRQGVRVVPRVRKALANPDLALYAARVVSRLGSVGHEAVPELITALSSKDTAVQAEAAFALGAVGPQAARAVPVLVKLLKSSDDRVRHTACYALGKIGAAGAESDAALSELQRLTASDDEFTRICAVWASLKIRNQPTMIRKFLPEMIGGLASTNRLVRLEMATLLGELGADAKPALADLRKLLQDPDADIRRAAEESLRKIGD